jgi:electron transport complex protein RnfC
MRLALVRSTRVRLRDAWPAHVPSWRTLAMPPRLRVPLTNGALPPNSWCVAAGSDVVRGQRLTDPAMRVAPAAFAPADGRALGVVQAALLNGQTVTALELDMMSGTRAPASVESDPPPPSAVETHPAPPELPEVSSRDLAAWIERIIDCGIAANRRSSPDLLGQLGRALRRPIDIVMCSLLEADPEPRLNAGLASAHGDVLVAGVALLKRLTSAAGAVLVAEAGTPYLWIARVRALCRRLRIRLLWPRNDYPQSDPALLLYTLLGRRLRPGRLPAEQGVLLVDAATAVALGRMAIGNKIPLHVPLAIRDHAEAVSHYVLAPPGMSVGQVLGAVGIATDASTVARAGDMLRDARVSLNAVVGAGELVLHVTRLERQESPDACIRCGWCAEGCPTRIQPAGILEASQRDDRAMAEHYGIGACIECGICSYVCPSRLPLLEGIRALRRQDPMTQID